MAIAEKKSERLEFRTTPSAKAFHKQAAVPARKTVTDEIASADRRIFRLNEQQWQAFQDILDRPVTKKPRLARLLAEKSALE